VGCALLFHEVCPCLLAASAAYDAETQRAAKAMETKLEILGKNDAPLRPGVRPVIVTEHEANCYLKIHSGEFLPPGVDTPVLTATPEHITASGDVDFNVLSRSYPNPNDWGPKILAAMFKGKQHVTVTGRFQSEDRGTRLEIESVVVGPLTVPSWLVDYFVENVLGPRYGIDLSKPFPYPDHVTRIVVGVKQATFLRGKRQ